MNSSSTSSDTDDDDQSSMDVDVIEGEIDVDDAVTAPMASPQHGPNSNVALDCYPYTFTPMLLFAQESYFDKGYSNYNSVAQFFASVMPIDMLQNVLYERRNMLYEELFEWITDHQIFVTCCIDSHFTALKVLSNKKSALYYDPLSPRIKLVEKDNYTTLTLYLLIKCNYGDSEHVRDNKDYYVSGNAVRRSIYQIWKKINRITSVNTLLSGSLKTASLDTARYFFINTEHHLSGMTTQLTGNTCYFQVYLFAVLCKVGDVSMSSRESIRINNEDLLETSVTRMLEFLMTFFHNSHTMRPLTNSNILVDFFRFKASPYYKSMVQYLERTQQRSTNYESQFYEIMAYFEATTPLHTYERFSLDGAMSSTPNTKSLQSVRDCSGGLAKLGSANYYKYRAANFMFGCNSNILREIESFSEWNAWRKNQLLAFCDQFHLEDIVEAVSKLVKYRDYYFMPQFEVGQQELVNVHHYTYLVDVAEFVNLDSALVARLHGVNHELFNHLYFSTQKSTNYDKMMKPDQVKRLKTFKFYLSSFLTTTFFKEYTGLGFAEINPAEKDINSLTQTVFYSTDLMLTQGNRQSMEFEKECINQMSRSTLRKTVQRFDEPQHPLQKYKVLIRIGQGYTFSKYNTLMHFLNVVKCYWHNPDLSNIQVFGKDIRTLLAVSCQKIFFDSTHCGSYYYGPFDKVSDYRGNMDLAVASSLGHAMPSVSIDKRKKGNQLLLTDRVYEFQYLRRILEEVFANAGSVRIKSDNEVINLCLMSLMLDFGLYEEHCELLHLPFLQRLQHKADTLELQVEIANTIYECDRRNTADYITRNRVEDLLFECGYKFLINKDFPINSPQFKLIRALNSDPDYQSYVLMCKAYLSLCQINKSVEVDYYKVFCDNEFRIVIPENYSRFTSDYLDSVTKSYTFSDRNGFMLYDDLKVFDLRPHQPEINLYRVRFDSASTVQSMVKYIEISNAFRIVGAAESYLVFIAGNVLQIDSLPDGSTTSQINKADVCVSTVFLDALSFIPCFKYTDTNDVILFTSSNFHYKVDSSGQFATDYYGMKHELIENIKSAEVFVDANDEHVFKVYPLHELVGESKTVLYHPHYLLQVHERKHLINLLDLSIKLRNIPFFILTLMFLRRSSVKLEYIQKENGVTKITGPWRHAVSYVVNPETKNSHYDRILKEQFFDLNAHRNLPMEAFIDLLCLNFTKFQRHQNGSADIVPRPRQKEFLKKIISSSEPFHFSEVGSGKTKVILPLFCQLFLSNNEEVHRHLSKGGLDKTVLVVLVPEHLVSDAKSQVLRYCLSMNFGDDYRIYDDIFALMHREVQVSEPSKKIFVTSFNMLKKALTYDSIYRDKLVFNICSNKNNSFDQQTIDLFFTVSKAAYRAEGCPLTSSSTNPDYWMNLYEKFFAINVEIQDASRSINKSFGIFNETTLRHCSTSIAHDIEGYKSLIARPYESVNRAMPGSYYSDVERTIFLTFVILSEDVEKYDELFQAERKFITFEYWKEHFLHQLDYDDLVYGHERFSEITSKHPESVVGLQRYLYGIILRRMEIRDKARSVNSVDIIFNFDAVGFTGTPFIDNYPTFDYIRHKRQDEIPGLIERSFYAYTSENLPQDVFENRFSQFQGSNNEVSARYVCSDFIRGSQTEMEILRSLFEREHGNDGSIFNVIVDLVGIFKISTVHDIRNMILEHFGLDQFHYIYHVDQADNSDRVLCIESENDVCFDEEFFKFAVKKYGTDLARRVFFFVDNRNVIGKDIPFQLSFLRDFGRPMFGKSLVLAHDVDDFSKIWQAMGRSRTMNATEFCIYRSGVSGIEGTRADAGDIKKDRLTRQLYISNCDRRIAGNISSIFLTLIAVFNLSNDSFYYCDTIVNTFLEKMENCLSRKVSKHSEEIMAVVLKTPIASQILLHILADKFKKSVSKKISSLKLNESKVGMILRHIVDTKFELRQQTGDLFDDLIAYLSGEQENQMEISYTKQQQKQKQTQKNKNHDSDAMALFDKKNQLTLGFVLNDYFEHTKRHHHDKAKTLLSLPAYDPIVSFSYCSGNGEWSSVSVYPTLQFLYSHFIDGSFMTDRVKETFQAFDDNVGRFMNDFFSSANATKTQKESAEITESDDLQMKLHWNYVRQNPQYTIAALDTGIYLIGTKDQFNSWDLHVSPVRENISYVMDEVGFVLFDAGNARSVDATSPYFIENYLLMELLAKQEVAQNVIAYFRKSCEELQQAVDSYDNKQGKGFVCWRFLMNARIRKEQASTSNATATDLDAAQPSVDATSMESQNTQPFCGQKRSLL